MSASKSHRQSGLLGVDRTERRARSLLGKAGIRIDGNSPWDIQVHDRRLYRRTFAQGSIGFGEAYMDGWWDCDRLDELFHRIHRANVPDALRSPIFLWEHLKARLFNLQKPSRAFEIGRRHYDIGNDLFEAMLDRRMNYSCGYWRRANDLDAAQEAKLCLIGDKLGLEAGMKVLDIGCGWGGAARFFAERYGVSVVGITVSEEQAEYARSLCDDLAVEIRLQDYRDVTERFDRVYSVGMFEHVGVRNYRRYMETARRVLQPGGLFLLHTIGGLRSSHTADPWITRYIFPNSMIPSARQICKACEGLFAIEDWHNFGADYDRTLMAWHQRFENAWPELSRRYDERFHRMWRFYLMCSAGSFRARDSQLWQIVLSPEGVEGGYRSIR